MKIQCSILRVNVFVLATLVSIVGCLPIGMAEAADKATSRRDQYSEITTQSAATPAPDARTARVSNSSDNTFIRSLPTPAKPVPKVAALSSPSDYSSPTEYYVEGAQSIRSHEASTIFGIDQELEPECLNCVAARPLMPRSNYFGVDPDCCEDEWDDFCDCQLKMFGKKCKKCKERHRSQLKWR